MGIEMRLTRADGDLKQARELFQRSIVDETSAVSLKEFREHVFAPQSRLLVLNDNDTVIGGALLMSDSEGANQLALQGNTEVIPDFLQRYPLLQYIAVSSDYQGIGLGKRLLNGITGHARVLGGTAITAITQRDTAGIEFFQQTGFHILEPGEHLSLPRVNNKPVAHPAAVLRIVDTHQWMYKAL